MTTKANRNRDAQKRIKKALSQHGIVPVNPDNWFLRLAHKIRTFFTGEK